MLPQFGVVAFAAKKIDVAQNDTLRLIAGCLRPALTGLLPLLPGIASPDLHREHFTYRLKCQAAFNNQHSSSVLSQNCRASTHSV